MGLWVSFNEPFQNTGDCYSTLVWEITNNRITRATDYLIRCRWDDNRIDLPDSSLIHGSQGRITPLIKDGALRTPTSDADSRSDEITARLMCDREKATM